MATTFTWILPPMNEFGRGYQAVYVQDQLTLGLNFPIEAYSTTPVPRMVGQMELAKRAEDAGFAALWSRDVPLLDPNFGDAGQIYDPWVWLGFVAAHTSRVALCTGSIILPLRRGVDLSKAAASVDQLSDGRLIMGVASGDRPVEYSVYEQDFDRRGHVFRDRFELIRTATHAPAGFDNQQAARSGQLHMIPKAKSGNIPLLVTGNSRQSPEWIAENADGWLMYPQPIAQQQIVVANWRKNLAEVGQDWKPFSQSLYIDMVADPDASPTPIHLGYRLGRNALMAHLEGSRDIGVNHITFNIRFSSRPVEAVLDDLATHILPHFPPQPVE